LTLGGGAMPLWRASSGEGVAAIAWRRPNGASLATASFAGVVRAVSNPEGEK